MSEPLEVGRIEIRPMPAIEELGAILNGAARLVQLVKASQPAGSDQYELADEIEKRLDRFNARNGTEGRGG